MKPRTMLVSVTIGLGLACTAIVSGQQSMSRGDLVLIKDSQDRLQVKTIIAVPGDIVSISDGRVTVNGVSASVTLDPEDRWGPRAIEEGSYFLAGDPLQLASDANAWGVVPASSILGTVQLTAAQVARDVYVPGAGVSLPVPLREVRPVYSPEALRAGIQGKVTLRCIVLPDGTVSDVRVIEALDSTLDQEAIEDGRPVAVQVSIDMTFTLR